MTKALLRQGLDQHYASTSSRPSRSESYGSARLMANRKCTNSGIDAAALRDGRVVLINNNTTSGRTPLNPAMIQTASGDLEMTYTWNRKTIEHVHFPLADVSK